MKLSVASTPTSSCADRPETVGRRRLISLLRAGLDRYWRYCADSEDTHALHGAGLSHKRGDEPPSMSPLHGIACANALRATEQESLVEAYREDDPMLSFQRIGMSGGSSARRIGHAGDQTP